MAGLINRYANDLLNYAREQNQLEEFYTNALILIHKTDWTDSKSTPKNLDSFLRLVPMEDVRSVLIKFMDTAQEFLGLLDVTVISAVPLNSQQRIEIENKLRKIFNRQIVMVTKTDKTLLGGLRIIAGNTIIDNTIKSKLSDLKKSVYKGVYFN